MLPMAANEKRLRDCEAAAVRAFMHKPAAVTQMTVKPVKTVEPKEAIDMGVIQSRTAIKNFQR